VDNNDLDLLRVLLSEFGYAKILKHVRITEYGIH